MPPAATPSDGRPGSEGPPGEQSGSEEVSGGVSGGDALAVGDRGHRREDGPDRFAGLLAGSAVGVYLLIVVGATTALLDGAGRCTTWPACNGAWLPNLGNLPTLAAWSHRVATVLVGGLLLATAWVAVRRSPPRRVRAGLAAALLLYPAQIAIGALTVVGATSTALAALHLVVAVAIFSALVLALLWHLEAVTAEATTPDGRSPDAAMSDAATTAGATPDAATTAGAAGAGRADGGGAGAGTHSAPTETQSPPPATPAASPSESTATAGAPPPRQVPSVRERAVGYVMLTKPKLWWLLCLVAVASMGLAAGPRIEPGTLVATVAGGILAIGASGTFNHVLERDIDRRMSRTDERPLVEGVVPVRRALGFGVVLAGASLVVFLLFVNVLAAALGVLAILFYSIGYTLVLKPNTSQNIVLGGAVGAFPALIGWAAVENTIGMPALVLGAVIFLWTPAHFYNLALAYRDDYASAGIPMLPVVRGAAVTRRHILAYLGATMVVAVLLGTTATLDWLYAVTATLAGAGFLWAVVRLHSERTEAAAFRAFHASNAYLGSLLLVVTVDAILV